MRTGHWIALVGSIAAMALLACSSTDTGGGPVAAKGGSGGNVVGKGGESQGGSGGTTAEGGSSQGGTSAGGTSQGGAGGTSAGGTAGAAVGGSGGSASCDAKTKQQTSECTACTKAPPGCDAQTKACADDSKCTDFQTCLSKCSDATCYKSCESQNMDGALKYWPAFGCMDAACHDKCYCTACSIAKAGTCETCVESKCMNECTACASDGLCVGLWACVSYCATDDTACSGKCQQDATLKGGITNLAAFVGSTNGCLPGQCKSDCQ